MDINVTVSSEEMDEMGFDAQDLESHITEALDSYSKELTGFYIHIEVK